MRKLLYAAAGAAALAFAALPASAGERYLHNGSKPCHLMPAYECSEMNVGLDNSGQFVILYSRPREGLGRIGIIPGTLLVSGRVYNGRFSGVSHRFRMMGTLRCSISYAVGGWYASGLNFVLEGPAPIFAENRCAAAGFDPNNEQSHLFFAYAGPGSGPSAVPTDNGVVPKVQQANR